MSSSAASTSREPASLSGGSRYSRTCSSKTSAIKPLIGVPIGADPTASQVRI
jgi:hypothetical protein